jgi:hypothetical protein
LDLCPSYLKEVMKNCKHLILFFGLAIFISSLSGFTIQPSIVELSLLPGQSTNGFYTVQNDLGCRVLVNVDPQTYFGKAVTNWLKPAVTSFTLNAGAKRNVEYRIILPKDFKDEYISKVYFSSVPLQDDETGGASIITRMGSSFYVGAKGKELLSADIASFIIQSNTISVAVKNNGNVHLRLYYDLEIFDEKGREITTTEERVPIAVALSGENKKISVPLKTDMKLPAGRYYGIINLYYGNVMPLVNKKSALTLFEVLK